MKIGLMGGTFDPVHNAHLIAAQTVLKLCGLDLVQLLPTNNPPHKMNLSISKASDRLSMLRLAVHGLSHIEVSTIELDRPGTTYTVDTLRLLHLENSFNPICSTQNEYFYIIGADVVFDLLNWKDCEAVFKMCSFIAMLRPGFERAQYDRQVQELQSVHAVKIACVEIPQMDISSTEIRRCFAEGRESEAESNLPKEVFEYIKQHGLYREGHPNV